jgi:hypothetical protein
MKKLTNADYAKYTRTAIIKIASYSAGATATSLILANTPVKKPYQKVVFYIGAFVIAELISSRTEKYVADEIDKVAASYAEAKKQFKTL